MMSGTLEDLEGSKQAGPEVDVGNRDLVQQVGTSTYVLIAPRLAYRVGRVAEPNKATFRRA